MKNKIILIYGLGKSGQACLRYCVAQNLVVRAIDDNSSHSDRKKLQALYSTVDFYFSEFNENILANVSRIIVSPGISLNNPLLKYAQDSGIKVMRDLEWFVQLCKAPIIGITGANGKTTVTTMLARLFSSYYKSIKVGGNIGIPLFEILTTEPVDYYIIEISSNLMRM